MKMQLSRISIWEIDNLPTNPEPAHTHRICESYILSACLLRFLQAPRDTFVSIMHTVPGKCWRRKLKSPHAQNKWVNSPCPQEDKTIHKVLSQSLAANSANSWCLINVD